jgi:hypothetical protein
LQIEQRVEWIGKRCDHVRTHVSAFGATNDLWSCVGPSRFFDLGALLALSREEC